MSLGEMVLEILKDQLLPEIRDMKQALVSVATRQENSEKESARRFDLIDRRFEAVDRQIAETNKRIAETNTRIAETNTRIEQQTAEHARRMDLLDKRIERVEANQNAANDRLAQLTDAVARLTLLGDYVRRVDELAAEVRELKRRISDEVLPKLPKTGT